MGLIYLVFINEISPMTRIKSTEPLCFHYGGADVPLALVGPGQLLDDVLQATAKV